MKTASSSLKNRYAESARTKDSGGSNGPFNFPQDTKFYKAKEGRNRLIILSYTIKTKKHPLVAKGRWKVGDQDYVMDVWIHQRFGGGDQDFVCLKKNYNKPCPCCEMAEEYRQAGKEEEYKAAKASRRVVYNVLDARAPDKGVMIFATSHFLFEHELIEEAIASGEGSEPVDFAFDFERKDERGKLDLSPSNGKIISFRGAMTKLGQNEYLEFKSFSFEDREEPLPRGIQDEVISLDEVMNVLSYEEMQAAIYGQSDEGEEDEIPAPRKRHVVEEDEEEDATPAPRKKHIEEDEDEEDEASAPRKKHIEEDEEEDEAPAPRKKHIEEEEDEEAPHSESGKKDASGECPAGYVFGKDWDSKPACSKCKVWDKCGDAFENAKRNKD